MHNTGSGRRKEMASISNLGWVQKTQYFYDLRGGWRRVIDANFKPDVQRIKDLLV
jgi:hypothetical protein